VPATLAWSAYTDPALPALERERIFAGAWQYVGQLGELGEAAGYFASRVGDLPVVVTRDGEGAVRAFLNVCRHRGSVVATGAAARETLQCPYHAWTYGLDGALKAAPRSGREPGFETEDISLRPASVGTWGPFVFVNPDPEAASLAEVLGELPELVAAAGVDVERLELLSRSESALAANWKLVAENFLECYHCSVAHPGFSALVDVSPESYLLDAGESFSTQLGPVRADGNGYDTSGEVERSQFQFLWPNTMINIFPGRPNFSIGPVLPAGPTRTERFLDYFFAPDADEAWIEELVAFDSQVGAEDRVLVEGVQRGVSAEAIEHGRLMGEAERLIVHFQEQVVEALEGSASTLEAPGATFA
jgi:phenylpropionate dioxygenase-like ring-hydroxylating dioxygenase large terminal subunit